MEVTVQYVAGCPHWRALADLVVAVAGGEVTVSSQQVHDPAEAERLGFSGSPTLLVDGRDPFATGHEHPGMTCRLYATPDGLRGSPTEAQVRAALTGPQETGHAG